VYIIQDDGDVYGEVREEDASDEESGGEEAYHSATLSASKVRLTVNG